MHTILSSPRNTAFSLVELSIVLVILGLITGGIMAGQSLVRSSELRAVPIEYGKYVGAVRAYREKYFYVPGDAPNATQVFKRLVADDANCPASSPAAVDSVNGSCDGNGDGWLNISGAAGNPSELTIFWRSLALGGFIEGSYTGILGPNNNRDLRIGINSPRSRVRNAGWGSRLMVAPDDSGAAYIMDYGNMFVFGAEGGAMTINPALTPEEAWNIDTKLDDGKPAYGKIIARYYNNACAAADDGINHTATNFEASYRISDNSIQCAMYFKNVY